VAPVTAPPQQPQYTPAPPQYQNVVTQNQPPQNVHHMNNDDIGNMFSDEELGL
jgi:hypothetical protein